MEFQVVIPVLISFAISVVLGPVIIPFLRRLKMGQTERTEGVQSHLKKAGTPTMGGVIFLIATAITALFYVGDYPKIIPVLFLTLKTKHLCPSLPIFFRENTKIHTEFLVFNYFERHCGKKHIFP